MCFRAVCLNQPNAAGRMHPTIYGMCEFFLSQICVPFYPCFTHWLGACTKINGISHYKSHQQKLRWKNLYFFNTILHSTCDCPHMSCICFVPTITLKMFLFDSFFEWISQQSDRFYRKIDISSRENQVDIQQQPWLFYGNPKPINEKIRKGIQSKEKSSGGCDFCLSCTVIWCLCVYVNVCSIQTLGYLVY